MLSERWVRSTDGRALTAHARSRSALLTSLSRPYADIA
jgi:hypothetical protein